MVLLRQMLFVILVLLYLFCPSCS